MRARSGWLEYDIEGDANGGGAELVPAVSWSGSSHSGETIGVVCSERANGTASECAGATPDNEQRSIYSPVIHQ